MDELAAFVLHALQRDGLSGGGVVAELLAKFAARGDEQLFTLHDFALRHEPSAVVFLRPERTAEMNEQDLDGALPNAVEENSGAHLGSHAAQYATRKRSGAEAAGRPA
ncbi:hypothetical protein BH09MYX1_BH09MYX1_41830 [soil metagenome]